uniref:Uncharacterized protein n=1 Tax=Anopheles stephensi TaxID=30069 RepID=A0A182YBU7_ANOST
MHSCIGEFHVDLNTVWEQKTIGFFPFLMQMKSCKEYDIVATFIEESLLLALSMPFVFHTEV